MVSKPGKIARGFQPIKQLPFARMTNQNANLMNDGHLIPKKSLYGLGKNPFVFKNMHQKYAKNLFLNEVILDSFSKKRNAPR